MNSPSDSAPSDYATQSPAMTPFKRLERNVGAMMEKRLALLQQPDEVFQRFFPGRRPTLAEKVLYAEQMVQRLSSMQEFENNFYHVELNYCAPFVQLTISRHDGGNCKVWRHLQTIKNELVGPEHEAVELFPAESRLVDTANQYHLWVHVDADFRFPFGYSSRLVFDAPLTYRREPAEEGAGASAADCLRVDGAAAPVATV